MTPRQMPRLGAAAAILNEQGEILLVKHTYGRLNWELPGGGAEPGESIVETAVREVREETGLHVQAQSMTGMYYEPDTDMLHFVFRCTSVDGAHDVRIDGKEVSQGKFWPQTSLPRPISDFTVQRIADALSGTDLPLPVVISERKWLY